MLVKFSVPTLNWNCLKASTKGMPSISPMVPPSWTKATKLLTTHNVRETGVKTRYNIHTIMHLAAAQPPQAVTFQTTTETPPRVYKPLTQLFVIMNQVVRNTPHSLTSITQMSGVLSSLSTGTLATLWTHSWMALVTWGTTVRAKGDVCMSECDIISTSRYMTGQSARTPVT